MRNTTAIESSRPAPPLMSYEAGRFDARDAAGKLGLVLAGLFVAAIGATLESLIAPEYLEPTRAQAAWIGFGSGLQLTGKATAFIGLAMLVWAWVAYEWRKHKAFNQDLASRELNGGLEIDRAVSVTDFDADVPIHAFAYCVSIHRRELERQERGGGPAPWAYRNATGPLMIGGRRMLTVDEYEAREAAKMLEQLGMVRGRGDKSAGVWVPESYEELIDLFDRNWRRVGKEA